MKTLAILTGLLVGTTSALPAAAQNLGCVSHDTSRLTRLDNADRQALYDLYDKIHLGQPHAPLGSYLQRPDLIEATLSANDELLKCNFWIGPIASLSFNPVTSATGVALTASKLVFKLTRKPKYTNSFCFRGVQRNFLSCVNDQISISRLLPNNSFKPTPLRGAA